MYNIINIKQMNFALITTFVTKDIILTSISTSIKATTGIISYLLSSKETDLILFKNELTVSDMCNNLNVILTLIEDIVKKHNKINPTKIVELNDNDCVDIIMEGNNLEESCLVLSDNIKVNKKCINLSEPVKKALFSTYEVIEEIKKILNGVHQRTIRHEKKYLKGWRTLNLSKEINEIKNINIIFEKRIKMLFEIIKIYQHSNNIL
jgi:hypothetical protein